MDNNDRLRRFNADHNLTQAQFASLMDVTVSAVSQWLSGVRPVPGPVVAYLDLFSSLPHSTQLRALAAVFSGVIPMDGMYLLHYIGDSGDGYASLTLANGTVYGFDPWGGIYDGHYTARHDGGIDVEVSVKMAAHSKSVIGGISQPFDWSFITKATIANVDEQTVQAFTNLGPSVMVKFKRMRQLPQAA
jgi:DNA-binding XRE family transcriptional regulator